MFFVPARSLGKLFMKKYKLRSALLCLMISCCLLLPAACTAGGAFVQKGGETADFELLNKHAEPVRATTYDLLQTVQEQRIAAAAGEGVLSSFKEPDTVIKIVATSFPAYDLVNNFFRRYPRSTAEASDILLQPGEPFKAANTQVALNQNSDAEVEFNEPQSAMNESLPAVAKQAAKLAATGLNFEIKLLVPPGTDMHSFDISAQGMLALQEADMVVAVGGEADSWLDDYYQVLSGSRPALFKLTEHVPLLDQVIKTGMELQSISVKDEHVWTDAVQEIKLLREFANFSERVLDAKHFAQMALYRSFAAGQLQAWTASFEELAQVESAIVASARHKTLFFADRFPLRYMCERLELDYYAAFPGCNVNLDPAPQTLAYLQKTLLAEQGKAVFYTELSNSAMAETVAQSSAYLSWREAWALSATVLRKLTERAQKGDKGEVVTTSATASPTGATGVPAVPAAEGVPEQERRIALWRSGHTVSSREFEDGVTLYDLLLSNLGFLAYATAAA